MALPIEAEVSASNNPPPSGDQALLEQVMALQKTVAQMQAAYQKEHAELSNRLAEQQAIIDQLQAGSPVASASAEASQSTAGGYEFPTSDQSVIAGSSSGAVSSDQPQAGSDSLFPTTDDTLVGFAKGGASEPRIMAGPSRSASGSYMNVSFDAVATFAASTEGDLSRIEVGDHDPQDRGFNLRNQELALSGAVDPYFEGFANIVFKLDNFNETSTEVEEAFLQTTSLPGDLQVKVGQFFSPFGRINPMHPHTWNFVDAPLVNGRFLGGDGLRGAGVRVAWLAPTPWYSQFKLAMQNGRGGTAYSFRNTAEDDDGLFFGRPTIDRSTSSASDFVWTGRWENSFDLSDTQAVVLGASGATGPNDTGMDSSTQLFGLDLFYKWKPNNAAGGWPFLKWQTEFIWRRFEAGLGADDAFPVAEKFDDHGLYTQIVWGFAKQWTAAARGDWLDNEDSSFTDDATRQDRRRASASITWYPTEFSKLRLQFNHDWLLSDSFHPADSADSIFLQTEFALGAHGAHKY